MRSRVRGVAGVILWLLLLRGTPGRGQSTVDLSVSVTGPPSATVNVSFSYTISVSSVGASTGTTVTDILPPYVQFVSSSLGSACVANSAPSDPSTTVVCSVTTVPSSFTITVNPTVAGSTINVVGIIGNEFDGNMSNNSSSLAVSVTGGSSGGETTNAGFFWTDFDGDGFADRVVYRPGGNSSWYVKRSDGQSDLMVQWGTFGDIPAPGNYGGDGRADYAVFRPSNGTWYVKTAEGTSLASVRGHSRAGRLRRRRNNRHGRLSAVQWDLVREEVQRPNGDGCLWDLRGHPGRSGLYGRRASGLRDLPAIERDLVRQSERYAPGAASGGIWGEWGRPAAGQDQISGGRESGQGPLEAVQRNLVCAVCRGSGPAAFHRVGDFRRHSHGPIEASQAPSTAGGNSYVCHHGAHSSLLHAGQKRCICIIAEKGAGTDSFSCFGRRIAVSTNPIRMTGPDATETLRRLTAAPRPAGQCLALAGLWTAAALLLVNAPPASAQCIGCANMSFGPASRIDRKSTRL